MIEWFCAPRLLSFDDRVALHARCGNLKACVVLEGPSHLPEAVEQIERVMKRMQFAESGWAKLWFEAYEAAE